MKNVGALVAEIFQSTLLMRGATWSSVSHDTLIIFQSTLLMRGATRHQQGTRTST